MQIKQNSLKSITVAYNNSLRILLNLPSRCSASFMFATNYIKTFNECIHSSIFSLNVIFISQIIFFLLITYILIFIISYMYTYWRSLLHTTFILYFFNHISYIYFYNLFNKYPNIFIHIFLTLHLYLYVDHIIALIVLYVLYFSYFFKLYFMYIYGQHLVWSKTLLLLYTCIYYRV